jgi:iron complex outermembrane recepter protein
MAPSLTVIDVVLKRGEFKKIFSGEDMKVHARSLKPLKPLVAAVTLALNALAMSALAQTAPAAPTAEAAKSDAQKAEEKKAEEAKRKAAQVETITVTGIRASLERSLRAKEDSGANVEVISAEDVGKMPDKNLADSLQRLAGVAVRTDYDEAEKVSIRGTNPDMSLILFNGHTVSGGDWYVSDQLSSSRSTSLSLMPSSVLNQAMVYKTSQANIVDGGLAGTINVTTRKPLDERKNFGGVVNAGAVYSDLPEKWAHQFNASMNWKNQSNTFGVIGQVFAENRFMRRDSVSRFAYGVNSGWGELSTATMLGITDASLAGTGLRAADLNGVRMPGSMSSEFVESERNRKGGMLSLQWRPTASLDFTLTGFQSEMDANNYGRLTSGAMYSMLLGYGGTTGGTEPNSSNGRRVYAQIRNPVIINTVSTYGFPQRVLVAADIVYPDGTTPQYIGNSEGFYRDGARATSGFIDLDAKWRVNDDLTIKFMLSTTKGEGETKLDQGATFARFGTGVSYRLGDLHSAPFVRYSNSGSNVPGLNADGTGYRLVSYGASGNITIDKETSYAADATYGINKGVFTTLEAGYRFADHERLSLRSGPMRRSPTLPTPPTGFSTYPSNFGNGLGGGGWDNTGFYLNPETLRSFIATQLKPTSPEFERRVVNEIDLRERQTAAYLMQNLDGDRWSGNVGLRFVQTKINAQIVNPLPAGRCPLIPPGQPVVPCAAFPSAINTAASSPLLFYDNTPFNPLAGTIYYKIGTERTFNDVLPSLNLRFEIAPKWIARFGASKTIGRQNYNILGAGFGTPTCNATGCTVTGPNPNLKPLYANNLDFSLGWYFAPRSLLLVNYFNSRIDGYVKTGANRQGETIDLLDPTDNVIKPFFIVSSSQQGAVIDGVEVIFERPIGKGFGFTSNVSSARTQVADGRPMTGASNRAANAGVYFENDKMSARLVYNYRDRYVASTTAPAPTANSQATSTINGVVQPVALTWAAPVSNVAFSFNYSLTKELRFSFDATNLLNPARATYRYSEEEQQKLDVSGRQYYLTLRYRF